MKIRKPSFDLNEVMQLNSDFNYLWSGERVSSLLGLGYSCYFEYLEYFIYAVSKFSQHLPLSDKLREAEKTFLKQEQQHAKAHKELNDFIYRKAYSPEEYHPRVYDFLYSHYKTKLEPVLSTIKNTNQFDPALKKALKEIAFFETTSCIGGIAFFDFYFADGRIDNLIHRSGNLGLLYLLAYHFAEEMEHCVVAHDIYEYIYQEKVWDKETLLEEQQGENFADLDSLSSSLHVAKLLQQPLMFIELQQDSYYQYSCNMSIKYVKENFHPNQPEVKKLREYYINKWDNEWEPKLSLLLSSQQQVLIELK